MQRKKPCNIEVGCKKIILDRLRVFWENIILNRIFLFIIFVGSAVRIYKFGSIPPGLNQDEATLAYDAYSLINYGIERNGYHFPVMLPAFGSGQSGTLGAYLLMPFLAVFDLNTSTSKIVHLIFGILTIVILYFTIKKIFDKHTALLSAFLLAISPWHIMLSRWGLDCNLFPAFFLLGCWALAYAVDNKKLFPISFSLFALSLYTYGTAYLVVPIFLLMVSIYLFLYKKIRFLNLLISTEVFLIIALPIFGFILINSFELTEINLTYFSIPNLDVPPIYRANATIFNSDFIRNSTAILRSLFNIILISQNDGLINNVIPEYGFIYLFSAPLIILGLFVLAVKMFIIRGFKLSIIIAFWLISSIVLALSMYMININRINIIFIPIIILIALALKQLSKYKGIYIVLIFLYCISFAHFSNHYFTKYSDQIGPAFFESFGESVIYANNHSSGKICITRQVNMPELAVLFYLKIDPNLFHETVEYFEPRGAHQKARFFDRYIFGFNDCNQGITSAYIIHNSEEHILPNNFTITKKYKYYSVALKNS